MMPARYSIQEQTAHSEGVAAALKGRHLQAVDADIRTVKT